MLQLITVRRLGLNKCSLTFPPLSLARLYSFMQLTEIGLCGENENALESFETVAKMIRTWAPSIESPAFYPWATTLLTLILSMAKDLSSTQPGVLGFYIHISDNKLIPIYLAMIFLGVLLFICNDFVTTLGSYNKLFWTHFCMPSVLSKSVDESWMT